MPVAHQNNEKSTFPTRIPLPDARAAELRSGCTSLEPQATAKGLAWEGIGRESFFILGT